MRRRLESALTSLNIPGAADIEVDGKALQAIDTSGAWMLIACLRGLKTQIALASFKPSHAKILEIIEHIEHPESIACGYCGPVKLLLR